MSEGALQPLLLMLALAGVLALVVRLLRALLRLALRAAELTTAAGLAEVSARRGDLTTLAERRDEQRRARRDVRIDLALTLLWLCWLAVPPFTGWAREAFWAAAPLWLLPLRPTRR